MQDKEWVLYSSIVQSIELGCGDSEILMLIQSLADYRRSMPVKGLSVLQAAISEKLNDVVKLLIDRGADVNASKGHYGAALQAAAFRGNELIVRLLIGQGVDINASGGHYGTALQAAANFGNESIVWLLIDRGADIIDLTTLAAVKKLADKFSQEGRWKKAEYLHSQVVNDYKKFNGDDHPNTLSQIEKLSTAVLELRKLEESEASVAQVLRGRGVSSGGNSQSTLKALENLSLTYFKQRRLKEAEELELRVLELLPEDHPDVSSVMTNLALIHSKGDRWEEGLLGAMMPQYLRNLRKTKWITSEFHQDPEPREGIYGEIVIILI